MTIDTNSPAARSDAPRSRFAFTAFLLAICSGPLDLAFVWLVWDKYRVLALMFFLAPTIFSLVLNGFAAFSQIQRPSRLAILPVLGILLSLAWPVGLFIYVMSQWPSQ